MVFLFIHFIRTINYLRNLKATIERDWSCVPIVKGIIKNNVASLLICKSLLIRKIIIQKIGPTRRFDIQDNIPNIYSDVWPRIAEAYKRIRNWTCESCRVDLSAKDHRQYLHAHHIDGDKANETSTNIQILCIKCHASQPLHDRIKGGKYRLLLKEFYLE